MQQNETLRQKGERFREFLDVTFQLTEEELQAIHGLIPMTQELFTQCMRKCEEVGAPGQMEELIEGFPEQYRLYREDMEIRSDETFAGMPYTGQNEWTPGADAFQTDALWQQIRRSLPDVRRT